MPRIGCHHESKFICEKCGACPGCHSIFTIVTLFKEDRNGLCGRCSVNGHLKHDNTVSWFDKEDIESSSEYEPSEEEEEDSDYELEVDEWETEEEDTDYETDEKYPEEKKTPRKKLSLTNIIKDLQKSVVEEKYPDKLEKIFFYDKDAGKWVVQYANCTQSCLVRFDLIKDDPLFQKYIEGKD